MKFLTVSAVFFLAIPALCSAAYVPSHVMPIPPNSACPSPMCTCTDGESSKAQNQQQMAICTDIPNTKLPKSVWSLTVNGYIEGITKRKIARLGSDLKVLDLSNCEVKTIESGSFDSLTRLVTLTLSNNLIEKLEPGMFKKNVFLRELFLDGNKLRRLDPSVFAKMNGLRELYLESNYLTEIPAKIPRGLTKLSLNHNQIGPIIDTAELREIKLKELDLSGNPLEELTITNLKDIGNVEDLCLGGKAITLPGNASSYLKHISTLSFIAVASSNAVLSGETLRAIGDMSMLTTLTIINYQIDSASFLNSLIHLINLHLQDVTVGEPSGIQQAFNTPKQYLKQINFDNSQMLAQDMTNNLDIIQHQKSLHRLSLRKGNITHLKPFNLPNAYFQIDISENPLHCDCAFAWLQNIRMSHSEHLGLILSPTYTACETPENVNGVLLTEFLNGPTLQCPDKSEGEQPVVVEDLLTTTTTEQSQFGATVWSTVEETNGQGEESLGQAETTNEQVEPQGQEETTNQQVETEETPDEDTDNVSEENQTQETIDQNVEPKSTSETSSEEQPIETEESSTNYDPHKGDDRHDILFIILGSVLLILLITGIVLLVVYCVFKKKGLNKVEPSQEATPQSFRQLKATEDTSLIKGVKK